MTPLLSWSGEWNGRGPPSTPLPTHGGGRGRLTAASPSLPCVHTPTNVGVRTLTNVGVRLEFDWTHCGRIRIGLLHHCGKYCLPFKG